MKLNFRTKDIIIVLRTQFESKFLLSSFLILIWHQRENPAPTELGRRVQKKVKGSAAARVAKCQFFTQIISVQLNSPKKKRVNRDKFFDIENIKGA